jgi:hypothetical protein
MLHAMYRQGDVVWGRGRWMRSLRGSAIRRCEVVEDAEDLVTHHIERLRIVSDELWNVVHVIQSARTPRDAPKIRAGSAVTRQGTLIPAEQILGPGELVPGIDRVLEILPEPRAAWRFLKEESPFFDSPQRPIDALKAGKVDDVVEAARTSGEAFT